MDKEHKHAAVLRAIADGKEVQARSVRGGRWEELTEEYYSPITHPHYEWRIKPEPKPDVVWFTFVEDGVTRVSCEGIFDKANLRLTFDGDDLTKLKSAEVIS